MSRLRPATLSDADAIDDYHHRCFLATYDRQIDAGEFGPPDRDGTREQLRSWFQPGSAFRTWVVGQDAVPIGHVTVLDHYLVHLFVDPAHHGRGLGSLLLAHGERELATSGHRSVELHARAENVRAISFYEHLGWTVTDRTIHTVEHGIAYDERILVKRLSTISRDPTSS